MKLYVIPGHGAGDPGACGHGYSEAERVRALATRIKALGGASVTLADFNRNYYEDNGISKLNLPSDYQIVELHMDSGPSSARGGHVIIQAGVGGADKYDNALAGAIAKVFPGRSESLVERDDLANPARAAAKGYGYRLVENGFISNAGDVKTFNSKMDDIARAYLDAFDIKMGDEVKKTPADYGFKDGRYVTTVEKVGIRAARKVASDSCCTVAKGTAMKLGRFKLNSVGNIWAEVLEGDHKGRYVLVRKADGTVRAKKA